jgi:hypothetical protein
MPAAEKKLPVTFLLAPIVLAVLFLLFYPPIPQDESYHAFVDGRELLGVPNFWNVVSNLGFAIVGAFGLLRFRDLASRILFAGVFLTSAGSAYYHWEPMDARLIWDRLPMTVVFLSLLSIVIGIAYDTRLGRRLLLPLLAFGILTIVWWKITGDLRPYGIAQFGPLAILFPAMYFSKRVRSLWPVVLLYALAKFAESFDAEIFRWAFWSGHTWKHWLSGLAAYWIYRWRRSRTSDPNAVGS